MLDEITSKRLHGCQIIDLVYKYTISGNEVIKEAFNRILTLTNEILYKQMREWMIYGNLDDKYEEFFICNDLAAASEAETASERQQRDEEMDGAGFMTNEVEELFIGSEFSSKQSQFTLNSTRLPSYINLNIAKKIQFTGELLQLFKSRTLNEIYAMHSSNDPNISQLSQNLSFLKVQSVVESDKCKSGRFGSVYFVRN